MNGFYWIITVRWSKFPGSETAQTVEGTIDAEQAARVKTRAAAFKSALAVTRRHLGLAEAEPVTVLFWSLESAELPGVAQ